MQSCLLSIKVAEIGRIPLCRFLICLFGDAVLFGDLSLLGAPDVSDDVLSPDCVLSRGSSAGWISLLVASLPARCVFGVK